MPSETRRPVTGSRYHGTFLRTLAYLGNAACRGVPSGEMPTKLDRERLRSLVEPHWRRLYNFVFRYRGANISRDLFVAALDHEGIPCDGRFYEPVYRSDLFQVSPEEFPQLKTRGERPVTYDAVHCPVSEQAAYRESVWLPQFLLLGDEQDVADIARAVQKVVENSQELAAADPSLAGLKSVSRADRPRFEKARNY